MVSHRYWNYSKTHFRADYIGYYFPFEDLRVGVHAAKRVLMKEKIDRQLSGQSGTIYEGRRCSQF